MYKYIDYGNECQTQIIDFEENVTSNVGFLFQIIERVARTLAFG